jgi:hypothetical protein
MTLSVMTLSKMAFSITIRECNTQRNSIQHKNKKMRNST